VRGPRGGYELARDPRRISADDILRAAGTVEEPGEMPHSDSPLLNQVVAPALAQAEHSFAAALSRISIEDLVHSADGFRKTAE
jgi:DNA-binding IscR family transcriptional regulator